MIESNKTMPLISILIRNVLLNRNPQVSFPKPERKVGIIQIRVKRTKINTKKGRQTLGSCPRPRSDLAYQDQRA